jgi:FkbM family methyltransferase
MSFKNRFKLLFARKSKFQGFFEKIHEFGIFGMNFSNTVSVSGNGEDFALEQIASKYPSEITLFDVGANVGHYSLLANKIFKGRARIFSFEPSEFTYGKLKNNLKESKARVFNFGMGNKDEKVKLYSDNYGSGLATIYHDNSKPDLGDWKSEEITLRTIDGFCKEQSIDRIHFLKIDTEGHEYHVLEGAKQMLESGKIDHIQFEFGPNYIDSRSFFKDFYMLLSNRYDIYRILKDGFRKIDRYDPKHEIFVSVNYLASLKNLK